MIRRPQRSTLFPYTTLSNPQNKAVVYGILFRATAETLTTIAADPKHLGAEIGFFAVLHTWGQTLIHHPHLHCVVPGGGISLDGDRKSTRLNSSHSQISYAVF